MKPDKEALAKIELPPNADKQQVKDYILAVIVASQKQHSFSDCDPQVEMLAKVGAQNMDVLINFAARSKNGPDVYVWGAVKKLARPEDKEIILQALPANHDLIDIVVKYGWVSDAKETLTSALSKENEYLPGEWIKAVASFQGPSTYADLTKYFIRHNGNKKGHSMRSKTCPGST